MQNHQIHSSADSRDLSGYGYGGGKSESGKKKIIRTVMLILICIGLIIASAKIFHAVARYLEDPEKELGQ